MGTQTAKKTNGKIATGKVACPNGSDCVIAQQYADTLALIDGRLEGLERSVHDLAGHTRRMNEENLSSRSAILESHEEVLKALRRMEGRENA